MGLCKVFNAENQSKDDIFTKALEVLVSLYKDAKEVIQIKDKESGLIIGKGFSDSDIRTINWTTICRNRCWHIIKIEIKDNKLFIFHWKFVLMENNLYLCIVIDTKNNKYG